MESNNEKKASLEVEIIEVGNGRFFKSLHYTSFKRIFKRHNSNPGTRKSTGDE